MRLAIRTLASRGPRGIVDAVRDTLQARADTQRLGVIARTMEAGGGTSISDAGLYPLFCALAATDDDVFRRFRRSLIYRQILEHVDVRQGWAYLNEIERSGPLLDQTIPLLESDIIGNPWRHSFATYGTFSPSTLRYLKVAADLAKHFGSLSGMSIAEIGVGYGGQCRLIEGTWPTARYELLDLPEVLSLAQRFLLASGVDLSNVAASDGRDPHTGSFDLVISNYAFSELHRDVQERYWERVISGSPRGYMTYNHISPPEYDSLKATELAARIPGSRLVPEEPRTHPENVILIWGMSS